MTKPQFGGTMIDTQRPSGHRGAQAYLESNAAFNAGCDARLAGLPVSANPYRDSARGGYSCHCLWVMGWRDVDRYWAQQPQGRPIRPLPLVLPEADCADVA